MSETIEPTARPAEDSPDWALMLRVMKANGYDEAKLLPDKPGFGAFVCRFAFTTAVLEVELRYAETSYCRRWCYEHGPSASAALRAWDGAGEPQGWHRNPETGRRRPDGDASKEYLNW